MARRLRGREFWTGKQLIEHLLILRLQILLDGYKCTALRCGHGDDDVVNAAQILTQADLQLMETVGILRGICDDTQERTVRNFNLAAILLEFLDRGGIVVRT